MTPPRPSKRSTGSPSWRGPRDLLGSRRLQAERAFLSRSEESVGEEEGQPREEQILLAQGGQHPLPGLPSISWLLIQLIQRPDPSLSRDGDGGPQVLPVPGDGGDAPLCAGIPPVSEQAPGLGPLLRCSSGRGLGGEPHFRPRWSPV